MSSGKITDYKDYKAFVAKFEDLHTTDDCFTPEKIYNAVLEHVGTKIDLNGMKIARPFFPNGNYKEYPYDDNTIVIDNPPFSIFTQIVKFYLARNIKFWLFAPHLTLLSAVRYGGTAVIVGQSVTYENKAKVATSFVTNILGDTFMTTDAELCRKIMDIERVAHMKLQKFPKNIITINYMQKLIRKGRNFSLNRGDAVWISAIDNGADLFGGGLLCSDQCWGRYEQERTIAEQERTIAEQERTVYYDLSPKEYAIIKRLNAGERIDGDQLKLPL